MKTRFSTDIIAWIIAATAAVLVRTAASDLPMHMVPTLLICGIVGVFWAGLRVFACRISQRSDARWLSPALGVASVFVTGFFAVLLIALFDISVARSVVVITLVLAGFGWGLGSELIYTRRSVKIA